MTPAQLGKQVKSLHPGAYDSHPDEVVGRALQARYPGLYESGRPAVDRQSLDSGTVPETPGTLKLQLQQLSEGKRRVVFVARGSKVKIDPKQYGVQKQTTPIGDFYFDPKLIKRTEITAAIKEHRLNEILGSTADGYGAPPKEELQEPVQAVVARDAGGETANSALTDSAHEKSAVSAAQSLTPPGGSVSVEPPEKEIGHRVQKFKQPAGKKWPPPGPRK